MARMNVYVPDELAEQARAAGLNVSNLTQEALRRALAAGRTDQWLTQVFALDPTGITNRAVTAAVAEARGELKARG